ncbi:hypothetical protein AB0I34_31870, partial [Kribbella sp. NPDC050281]|uniref:three-helix bundle dimerization domain-containing protein n=1 Tax=Kribbella sp. NPDC050281 TaxID=3155515 RepID=UPI0034095519
HPGSFAEAIARLRKQFPDVPADDVAAAVEAVRPEFEPNPIRDFVPLFVERGAKDRLRGRVPS